MKEKKTPGNAKVKQFGVSQRRSRGDPLERVGKWWHEAPYRSRAKAFKIYRSG